MNAAAYELETFSNARTYDSQSASSSPSLSSIKPKWKRDLHGEPGETYYSEEHTPDPIVAELLEYPSASSASFLVHVLTTSLILLSALVTICETIPTFRATSPSIWFGKWSIFYTSPESNWASLLALGIESSLVVLFTVEYVARALAWSVGWSVFWRWALSFFGIVDFLAIAPYYIELFLGVDTSVMFRFSILRTFRLLRVFRAFRTNNTITLTIEVMYLSVRHSQHALLALGFFLVMFLVVFSTILYFIERGTWDPILQTFIDVDGEPSQFSSIPAAGWFVLVTITTVGYGDLTPRSFLGRLLTVPLLVFGLLLIALPSFVLGREFSALWDAHARDSARAEARETDQLETDADEPSPPALVSRVLELQRALDAQSRILRQLLHATEVSATFRSSRSSVHPKGRGEVLFDAPDNEGDGSNAESSESNSKICVSNTHREVAVEGGKGKERDNSAYRISGTSS